MIWIILGIIVVLVLIVVGVYNGLVKSRMQTREAWSQIDVQLKRRNDLIPNLIETVKGYAKYRRRYTCKSDSTSPTSSSSFFTCRSNGGQRCSSRQVAGIFAVAENYPDLKANTNFMQLQEELTNTENKNFLCSSIVQQCHKQLQCEIGNFPNKRDCWNVWLQTELNSFKCLKKKKQYQRWTLAD